MIFFTDITTNVSSYCLLNVKQYNDIRKANKKLIFIDPAVYELKLSIEYSRIDFLHNLVSNLHKNEYISIDYPCDMNPIYSEVFIEKSYQNNVRYADNSHYICTIQSKFHDFNSFIYESERLRPVWKNSEKVIGIGNMCRIMNPDSFCDSVFQYITDNFAGKRVHLYGLSLKLIKKYVSMLESHDISVSVDSTKWTKRVHRNPPLDESVCCKKETRDIYFLEYMKEIQKYNIKIEF